MEFRKVALDNLDRLSEMFRLCLNRTVDESYFVWKYKNNPSGEVIAFEAVEGDTIAGFYGVIPEKYVVAGQEVIVYQSMDTMTHPDFQKRGLFTKLAQMTYDYLQSQHEHVYIVGIPGGNSFHGFVNKLNWKNIHNFQYLFLPRPFAPFNTLLGSKDWRFDYCNKEDGELIQHLDSYTHPDQLIRPKIDSKVFKWKVWDHPFKDYKVIKIYHKSAFCGFCICSVDERNFIKIELIQSTVKSNTLLRSLSIFIFKTNPAAKFIYTWRPTDSDLTTYYKKAFFLANPFDKGPFSYKIPFITYSDTQEIMGKNWFDINSFDVQPFLQD